MTFQPRNLSLIPPPKKKKYIRFSNEKEEKAEIKPVVAVLCQLGHLDVSRPAQLAVETQ